MTSLWLWWCLLMLWIAAFALADDRVLSEWLRADGGGVPGERVRRMRDAFARRLRCGAGIAEELCRQDCLSAERILDMTRDDPGDEGEDSRVVELSRASVVFLNYFLTFRTSCTADSARQGYVGSCRTYDRCRNELHDELGPPGPTSMTMEHLEALERVLRKVKAVFEPEPSAPCFSAESLLKELDGEFERFHMLPKDMAIALLLTSHLYSGECIDVGESVADFLDDLFLHYGDGCEMIMTQSGFGKLWNDLQMQRRGKHIDHGVQKNVCSRPKHDRHPSHSENHTSTGHATVTPTTYSPADIRSSHSPVMQTSVRTAPNEENSATLVVLIPSSNVSELSPNPNVYVVGKENSDTEEERMEATASTLSNRKVRHTSSNSEGHEHKNLANECLPSDDLLHRFLSPGNQVITSSEFLQLCPALVQQAVSGVCSVRLRTAATSHDSPKRNHTGDIVLQVASQGANIWFAVASVSLITAVSLLGLFLLPVLKKSFFIHINAFFTGLAFGTMSGDVVLHLMPQYLGLHRHDDSIHKHDSESTLDRLFPSYLQRQLAFLLTMYLLLLMECIFAAVMGGQEQRQLGHSHDSVSICLRDLTTATVDIENGEMKPKASLCSKIVEFLKPSNLFTGISSKAAVIILADTVHNFADGMAIAVGFSTSYKDGFSTSVAVFFHELPHEIGDFAVLMNCGLSYWKAFVFNVLSGLSSFLGLGVGAFTARLFREWLLCITAGLFFFVVMGEMLPDMRLESREKWREFIVKVAGTIFGILTMICIAMYELSYEA